MTVLSSFKYLSYLSKTLLYRMFKQILKSIILLFLFLSPNCGEKILWYNIQRYMSRFNAEKTRLVSRTHTVYRMRLSNPGHVYIISDNTEWKLKIFCSISTRTWNKKSCSQYWNYSYQYLQYVQLRRMVMKIDYSLGGGKVINSADII